jgi:hypothetical protein
LAILHAENPNPRDDPRTQEKKTKTKRRETTTEGMHAPSTNKLGGVKWMEIFRLAKN